MKYQSEGGVAVLNGANEGSLEYKKHLKGTLRTFSGKTAPDAEGAYVCDGAIFYKDRYGDEKIVELSEIKIPGSHNVENYMAAICATRDLVKTQTVKKVATSFTGVKHRLQLVRIKDGVRFYNSSIDSSPSRTTAALSSFKEKNVIVILGGKDKKVPFDSLSKPLSEKCKCAVLTGMAREKIYEDVSTTKEFMEGKIRFYKEPDFEAAVKLAAGLAESGDAVLLSPACTSFDRFLNFEQRGEFFTDIVNSL
jgi:UDP-N-acetylmuramoylalanine--D-glutamate ligase